MTREEIDIAKQTLVTGMKNYIDIFIERGKDKPYSDFSSWLIRQQDEVDRLMED